MSTPKIITSSPLDNALGIMLTAGKLDISLTFDQNMTAQSGSIYLYDYFTDDLIDSIAAGELTISVFDRTKVTWSGATGTQSQLYILADLGVLAGTSEDWPGITDKTTLNFGVKGAPPIPDGSTQLTRDFPAESSI